MERYCLGLLRQFIRKICLLILKQHRLCSVRERISSVIFRLCEFLDILSVGYDFHLFTQNGQYRLQIQPHKLNLFINNKIKLRYCI